MPRGTRKHYEERILRVQMHIQQHLDDALSLEELAEVACFSPFHFHRIFSAMVGENVKEHVRRLRLERAAGDLMYSDRRVTEIAFRAGYETHEAFTRAFRNVFGLSPKAYRDDHRNGSLPRAGAPGTTKPQPRTRPGETTMEARIDTLEPMTVAFVRHVGPYDQCAPAWQKLCSTPAVLSQMGPDTLSVGISYDDPDVTEPDKIRYAACRPVGDDFEPADAVDKQ
ncbi:MAG: AraC family transcriptional regulator, partial [bacterium]|nr:AraC family transcriptional regulator [bacterium]